jgi:hypothetical protein
MQLRQIETSMVCIIAISSKAPKAFSIAIIAVSTAISISTFIAVSIATIAASVAIVNLSVTVAVKPERKHNVAYNPHNIKYV